MLIEKTRAYIIFFLLTFIFIYSSCGPTMDESNVNYIKKKYSIEEINYFYEIAFFSENLLKNSHTIQKLKKWDKDILFQ